MRFIELFAGIGGFRYGLENCGRNESYRKTCIDNRNITHATLSKNEQCSTYRCIWANELDKYASQIYRKNFGEGELYEGDIRTVRPEDIPEAEMLVGGFPCQAFSIAGKRKGFENTRGTLFYEIARIARANRYKTLLLENVYGLLNHEGGDTFAVILGVLDEMGYDVEWQVLNSKDFGVPQNRERVFIIGHLRGERRPEIFPIGENCKKIDELQGQQTNTLKARYEATGDGSYVIEGKQYAQEIIAYSSSQRKNHIEHRIKSGEANCLTTGKGCAGGMKSSTFVKLQNKNMKGRRIKEPSEDCFTLGSGSGCEAGVTDGTKIRRLTPMECERLQGFPDGWTKGISDTQRYKCLGNAVTTNVIEAIGKKLIT